LKRDIMSQLDVLAHEAKAIGAVKSAVIPYTNMGGYRGLLGDKPQHRLDRDQERRQGSPATVLEQS